MFEEISWQLVEDPPADRLIQTYFIVNKLWAPPTRTGLAVEAESGDAEIWESDLPEVTD